jgi:hypothetical protein
MVVVPFLTYFVVVAAALKILSWHGTDFMQLNRNNLVGSVPDSLCGRGGVQEYFVDPDIHCSCCLV